MRKEKSCFSQSIALRGRKNLNLALRAYAVYRKKTAATGSPQSRLVIAGGYDVRLKENVDHFNELKR